MPAWVTGHSLGGTLATYAGLLCNQTFEDGASASPLIGQVVTFNAPNGSYFVSNIPESCPIWNFVNTRDATVPYLGHEEKGTTFFVHLSPAAAARTASRVLFFGMPLEGAKHHSTRILLEEAIIVRGTRCLSKWRYHKSHLQIVPTLILASMLGMIRIMFGMHNSSQLSYIGGWLLMMFEAFRWLIARICLRIIPGAGLYSMPASAAQEVSNSASA